MNLENVKLTSSQCGTAEELERIISSLPIEIVGENLEIRARMTGGKRLSLYASEGDIFKIRIGKNIEIYHFSPYGVSIFERHKKKMGEKDYYSGYVDICCGYKHPRSVFPKVSPL